MGYEILAMWENLGMLIAYIVMECSGLIRLEFYPQPMINPTKVIVKNEMYFIYFNRMQHLVGWHYCRNKLHMC